MYKWTAFPFIRIALCLIFGITLFDYFPEVWAHFDMRRIFLVFFLAVFNWKFTPWPVVKGVVYVLLLMYTGGCLALLSDATRDQVHYTHYPHAKGFSGVVLSDVTERTDYFRFEVALNAICIDTAVYPTNGKIYLYVKKQDSVSRLSYGDVIASRKGYFEVEAPKNPDEFDYKKYLKRQGIYAHAFVSSSDLKLLSHAPPNPLLAWAYTIRSNCKLQISDYVPEERERAILTALLLGVKDYLDEDLKTAYSSAGAMHVLAVSGLHVGIVYVIISFLFKRWRNTRKGKIIFMLVATGIIWLYAMITGFSPSVMRAVTMFTVVIVSDGFGRRSNIFNSLGIAAVVLMLYDAYIIYSVGFQLSFAAVFGIVILHSGLYRQIHFSNIILDKAWSISCVSIAAQIATFPLTLLYFHQFPTYFLISNLVVIPAATVMLIGGIAMLVLGSFSLLLGRAFAIAFQPIVWVVNELVDALRFLPYPLFDWLYFDVRDAFLVYMIMGFCILLVTMYRFRHIALLSISILMLSAWQFVKNYHQGKQQRIVFYEIEGVTAIDLIKGNEALLLIDSFDEEKKDIIAYQVNPHRLANGLPRVDESWQSFDDSDLVMKHPLFDLLEWQGVKILMPGNIQNYHFIEPISSDFILFRDADRGCLNQMICDQVILGNDFNFYEARATTSELERQGLSVHSLSADGYKEIDLTGERTPSVLVAIGLE